MELTTDNRSPDMSFENDADGIPVEGNESILDISLRLHDYGQFRPVPSIIRHQCQQAQPHTVSVSTQTDETRIPKTTSTQTPLVETASNGCQATRPAFTFEDVTDDNSKVLFLHWNTKPRELLSVCLMNLKVIKEEGLRFLNQHVAFDIFHQQLLCMKNPMWLPTVHCVNVFKIVPYSKKE
ncbi:uncharacterized protein LOC128546714 [Mercenaria mercenaria]|uniref:uncharacterized protein LOC128546714 n=1 Tax=Mercenaria mercenaria TaxID=6596 RepID=UPI00234EE2B1|nr:uncharacterized protein LOC128546714 [Mercenaria mercenaria]